MKLSGKLSAIILTLCMAVSAMATAFAATPDEPGVKHDVNMDGAFSVKDATDLQKHIAGIEVKVNPDELDANYDGYINIKDSTRLQKLLAGLTDDPTPTEIPKEEEDIGGWF